MNKIKGNVLMIGLYKKSLNLEWGITIRIEGIFFNKLIVTKSKEKLKFPLSSGACQIQILSAI